MSQNADASRSSEQGSPGRSPERFTAALVCISDVLACSFVRQEGWKLNYLLTPSSRRITRLNLIAVLVGKPDERTLVLDDGSGVIAARLLEAASQDLNIGDVVLLIARPGEVNGTKYILPEIVKGLDNADWLKVRKLELELRKDEPGELVGEEPESPAIEILPDTESPAPDAVEPATAEPAVKSPAERLCRIIRELDTGSGVETSLVEERAAAENIGNPGEVIQSLLEQGEIFVPRPGLVKTLE